MRRRLSIALGLCVGAVLALTLASPAHAQETKAKAKEKAAATKLARVEGNVHMIDKASKTVTVQVRGKTEQKQVIYSDSTSFTYRNKPAKMDDLKDGRHVICLGDYNDKLQLIAKRIDVRDTK